MIVGLILSITMPISMKVSLLMDGQIIYTLIT